MRCRGFPPQSLSGVAWRWPMPTKEAMGAAHGSPLEIRRLHQESKRLVTGAVRFDIFSSRFWLCFGVTIHLIVSCLYV